MGRRTRANALRSLRHEVIRMKKTRIFLFILSLCLLLSACADGDVALQPAQTEAAAPAAAVSPTPTPSPRREPEPSPSLETQPPLNEVPSEKIEGIFPLLDQNGVRLELVISRNAENMAVELYLWLYLEEPGEDATYTISDFVLNDCILLPEDHLAWTDEAAQGFTLEAGSLFSRGILSPEDLRSFRCHIRKSSWDSADQSTPLDTDCYTAIPEGFRPDYVFLDCLGVRAEEQVLCDDGSMCVTLQGLGTPPWKKAGRMGILLQAENRSAKNLPFTVSGLSANGAFCTVYGDHANLPPGSLRYLYIDLPYDSFTKAEITQIRELSLLLLTDESENTGAFTVSGGSWYPVELIGSSGESAAPVISDPIFENDWIRVGLAGTDQHPPILEGRDCSYSWRLIVENISNTDLQLYRYEEDGEDTPDLYFSDGKIGAGGWRYVTVTVYVPEGTPRPAIPLRLIAHTLGGGKLLFLADAPMILPAE